MINKDFGIDTKYLGIILTIILGLIAIVLIQSDVNASSKNTKKFNGCHVLIADRLFDGFDLHEDAAVLFEKGKIIQVGVQDQLIEQCENKTDFGDATILPGFIESHAHIFIQNVSTKAVLKHGITTVRDVGGPLQEPLEGAGSLRILSAGPVIQATDGYPLIIFGHNQDEKHNKFNAVGIPVETIDQAEQVVEDLVAGGATIIKISLEPGGEKGAPWMSSHGHGILPSVPWPVLSFEIVKAIVEKAHTLNKRVLAHVSEDVGVEMALDAGVDEWAHIPCAEIRDDLLHRAVEQNVTFITTIDSLSSCAGIHANTHKLAHVIANTENTKSKFVYGSEIGHDNVPWGINAEEMRQMLKLTSGEEVDFTDVLNVFKAATSEAGKNLGLPLLGTLSLNAPADIIVVRGNPFIRFKLLEYPDLVISGGKIMVNNFKKNFHDE